MKNIVVLINSFIIVSVYGQSMDDYTGQVFPVNHALNTRIDMLPVHPNSDNFIKSIGQNAHLHPDFGTEWDDDGVIRQIGIPYNVVDASQPLLPITFSPYGSESDPGPWPIPKNPYIETVSDWRDTENGDRHMLIINSSTQMLYETGNTFGNAGGTVWQGGAGAIFDLTSNNLRPETWTSADAAGLPIFPLLIRYDEVERAVATGGEIPHAIRFTVDNSQHAYIWPARHYASSSVNPDHPPMGLRFRLKAGYDISNFSARMQVILRTFKKYGIIVSDNGSDWYFQGTHDDRWGPDEIDELKGLIGDNFEAVDISSWIERQGFDINSAAVPPGEDVLPVNVEENNLLNNFKVNAFYNSLNETLEISMYLPKTDMVIFELYDVSGMRLSKFLYTNLEEDKFEQKINMGTYTSGLYLFRIHASENNYSQSFCVTK